MGRLGCKVWVHKECTRLDSLRRSVLWTHYSALAFPFVCRHFRKLVSRQRKFGYGDSKKKQAVLYLEKSVWRIRTRCMAQILMWNCGSAHSSERKRLLSSFGANTAHWSGG